MGFSFFPSKSKTTSSIKNKTRTIARSDHSFSSSSSHSSSEPSTSPRSVLLPPLRRGHDGTVCRRGLADALRRLVADDTDEVEAVLAEADPNGQGRVRIEEICASGDEEAAIREAFKVYDLNGDGRISAEELREVMARIGDERCSVEDCRKMIGVVDSDGDGFVGFEDFARMMATWR